MEDEPLGFKVFDYIVDGLFFTDIVITCLMVYYDENNNLVTDHKLIFCNYLKGWMLLDFVATIPIGLIFETSNYNSLIRVARLPRLYRLVKMTKLARIAKLSGRKKAFRSKFAKFMKISAAMERLTWFIFTFLVIVHLVACFWGLIGLTTFYEPHNSWIFIYNFRDESEFDLYRI